MVLKVAYLPVQAEASKSRSATKEKPLGRLLEPGLRKESVSRVELFYASVFAPQGDEEKASDEVDDVDLRLFLFLHAAKLFHWSGTDVRGVVSYCSGPMICGLCKAEGFPLSWAARPGLKLFELQRSSNCDPTFLFLSFLFVLFCFSAAISWCSLRREPDLILQILGRTNGVAIYRVLK